MHNILLLEKIGFIASLQSESMRGNSSFLTKYKAKIVIPILFLFYMVLFFIVGVVLFVDVENASVSHSSLIMMKFGHIFAMALYVSMIMSQFMLFEFKDKEFLLILPVSSWEIVASKLLVGMIYTFVPYLAMMMGCAYSLNKAGISQSYFLYAVASILNLFPVFCLGSFIAILFRKLVDRRKHAKGLRTALQTLFIMLLMLPNMVGVGNTDTARIAEFIPSVILSYKITSSLNLVAFILLVGLNIVFGILFSKFLVKQILGFEAEGTQWKAEKYVSRQEGSIKRRTLPQALLKYNFKQLFAIPGYFLTVSMGLIYALIICVVLCVYVSCFMETSMVEFLDGDSLEYVAAIFLLALYAVGCSCGLCAISISIEGECFSIFKTAPLRGKDIIAPKILVNFIVIVAVTIFCWSLLTFIIGFNVLFYLIGIVLLAIAALRVSLIGMTMGLLFPRMDMDRVKTLHSISTIGTPAINLAIVYGLYKLADSILIPYGVSINNLVLIALLIELVICGVAGGYLYKRCDDLINRIVV